jgi:hypothetical protein
VITSATTIDALNANGLTFSLADLRVELYEAVARRDAVLDRPGASEVECQEARSKFLREATRLRVKAGQRFAEWTVRNMRILAQGVLS